MELGHVALGLPEEPSGGCVTMSIGWKQTDCSRVTVGPSCSSSSMRSREAPFIPPVVDKAEQLMRSYGP